VVTKLGRLGIFEITAWRAHSPTSRAVGSNLSLPRSGPDRLLAVRLGERGIRRGSLWRGEVMLNRIWRVPPGRVPVRGCPPWTLGSAGCQPTAAHVRTGL